MRTCYHPLPMETKLREIISKWEGARGSVIPLLQETQELYGYLSQETMAQIARATDRSASEIYGVATFYSQFRFQPRGKHVIKVCHGTACHVAGAELLDLAIETEFGVLPGETSEDGLISVERVACLGCCSLAPVVMVDDEVYGRLSGDKLVRILKKLEDE